MEGRLGKAEPNPLFLGYKLPSSSIAEPPRNPQKGHCFLPAASDLSCLLALPQFLRSQTATGRSCHRALTSPACPLEKSSVPRPAPHLCQLSCSLHRVCSLRMILLEEKTEANVERSCCTVFSGIIPELFPTLRASPVG